MKWPRRGQKEHKRILHIFTYTTIIIIIKIILYAFVFAKIVVRKLLPGIGPISGGSTTKTRAFLENSRHRP